MWYARGECEGNYQYMSENCPRACGYCENAGLMPTPATFQLDFVCKGQLAKLPSNAKASHYTPEALPEACSFRCRDNMTASCAKAMGRARAWPSTRIQSAVSISRPICASSVGLLQYGHCSGQA